MRRENAAEPPVSGMHVSAIVKVMSKRRVCGRQAGLCFDGRSGKNHKWQLRRVHACQNVNGVVQMEIDLPWENPALPESYATAWTCLSENLELAKRSTC